MLLLLLLVTCTNKAGDISGNVLNEIKKIIYSLYWAKKC